MRERLQLVGGAIVLLAMIAAPIAATLYPWANEWHRLFAVLVACSPWVAGMFWDLRRIGQTTPPGRDTPAQRWGMVALVALLLSPALLALLVYLLTRR